MKTYGLRSISKINRIFPKVLKKLIDSLDELRSAIDGGDVNLLKEVLREGKVRFENCGNLYAYDDISVRKLK